MPSWNDICAYSLAVREVFVADGYDPNYELTFALYTADSKRPVVSITTFSNKFHSEDAHHHIQDQLQQMQSPFPTIAAWVHEIGRRLGSSGDDPAQ